MFSHLTRCLRDSTIRMLAAFAGPSQVTWTEIPLLRAAFRFIFVGTS
jgi:hypothetical protein